MTGCIASPISLLFLNAFLPGSQNSKVTSLTQLNNLGGQCSRNKGTRAHILGISVDYIFILSSPNPHGLPTPDLFTLGKSARFSACLILSIECLPDAGGSPLSPRNLFSRSPTLGQYSHRSCVWPHCFMSLLTSEFGYCSCLQYVILSLDTKPDTGFTKSTHSRCC